jgi:hypothetical protein
VASIHIKAGGRGNCSKTAITAWLKLKFQEKEIEERGRREIKMKE